MIKVSVILTTYNSENQIQEVIDSIHKQEGKDESFELELLVIDDCSTDSTQSILLKNNINFQITNKNTGGPNHGRNIALSICTGNYICIADHDDIWFSNKVIQLLSVVDLAPIVTSGYVLSDTSSLKEISRVSKSVDEKGYLEYKKNVTFLGKLTKSKLGQQTYLGSILFHSSLKHILFEEECGMIDFDWVLKLFHNRNSVEVCSALYLRKVEGNNLSLNEQYRINDYYYSFKSILTYKNEYPSEVKRSEKRINGSMGRYYYLMGNMKLSRKYLLKSTIGLKTILYLITTFVGSKIVKKYFNIFG
jgi:glycosyltransferase involved in cell wall biosynthesis